MPQFGSPSLRLLQRVGRVDPESLDAYRASGGYAALARAIELGPAGVIREVLASKLMGRGGAAFPTGRKWDAVAKAVDRPHYVVCNADESEPGTFKDRVLMEGDPFAVLEGMTIAGFATGSERVSLRARGVSPGQPAGWARRSTRPEPPDLLGKNVQNAGFSFDVELRRGAGAYICGEETALFNSIEGKRGEPRNKPPFPVQSGLFAKPTVINNVETLVNIPPILLQGGAAYAGIGTSGSSGPKLFCVSGHVSRPGVYEVDFGISLGALIAMAGGVPGGKGIRAVLLGGAAGVFVGPDKLEMPLTFEGTRAAGATLGSGVVLVFDESVDLGDILVRIAAFFRDESCGQCVPCRVGTVRQEELLHRLRSGRPIGDRDRGDGPAQGDRPGDAGRLDLRTGTDRLQCHRVGVRDARSRSRAGEAIMIDDSLWFRPPPRPSSPPTSPRRPEPAAVEVVIDGQPAKVPASWTILEACRSQGIDTPTLCYLENLTPVNVCRVCVVELAGARTLVPACSRPVEPGMDIRTDSPRVRLARKMVLEFLGSSVDLSTAPQARGVLVAVWRLPRALRAADATGARG